MQVYVAKEGQRFGPFSQEQIEELIESGQLTREDLFWTQGMPEWQPLAAALPPPIPPQTQSSSHEPKGTPQACQPQDARTQNFFARIHFAPLALAVLAFLMPFVEVSCTLQRNLAFTFTGAQLAFGTEIQVPQVGAPPKTHRVDPVPLVLLALTCVVLALAVCFLPWGELFAPSIAGVAVVILLIFQQVLKDQILKETQGTFVPSFLFGFWLVLTSLVAGIITQVLRPLLSVKNGRSTIGPPD